MTVTDIIRSTYGLNNPIRFFDGKINNQCNSLNNRIHFNTQDSDYQCRMKAIYRFSIRSQIIETP